MKTIKFILVVLAILAALMLTGITSASELSEYRYAVEHQNDVRSALTLSDMAYHMGGMDKLEARMDAFSRVPVLVVNADAVYSPIDGNIHWTGYWGTKY